MSGNPGVRRLVGAGRKGPGIPRFRFTPLRPTIIGGQRDSARQNNGMSSMPGPSPETPATLPPASVSTGVIRAGGRWWEKTAGGGGQCKAAKRRQPGAVALKHVESVVQTRIDAYFKNCPLRGGTA